jgi:predicted ATPase
MPGLATVRRKRFAHLPTSVSALANVCQFLCRAMHVQGQLLLVEQPEAQLHPTAQLELGTFFATLWKERRAPTIVETHSANILLRLRKLIAQGALRASDVTIAYFDVGRVTLQRGKPIKTVVVSNLDINSDGTLGEGLPMEFFGADLIEALRMGAQR